MTKETLKEKVEKAVKKVKTKSSIKKEKKSKEQIKIEVLEIQLQNAKNDYLRTLADFQNFRKRNEEEKAKIRDNSIISFVQDLLPSIDNFEMSLKMTDNKEMFIKGVEMIHQNLLDTLKKHHIEYFETKENELFDPNKHEPVLIEDKSKEAGKVLVVLQKGYKHKEKVIRPARVQVVKK